MLPDDGGTRAIALLVNTGEPGSVCERLPRSSRRYGTGGRGVHERLLCTHGVLDAMHWSHGG